MFDKIWHYLQLFAEGGEGGEGAATGEAAVDPGTARLLELGVPADKIRKRAKSRTSPLPAGAVRATAEPREEKGQEQDAAAPEESPTETAENEAKAPRMTWEEIMQDPEYNQEMQKTMKARLRKAGAAEEAMGTLAPALELLARKHKMDPGNMDYTALAKAISEDDSLYEGKALEMGVSLDMAKRMDQQERQEKRQRMERARTIQEQKMQLHFQSLEQQGQAMKATFPSFDLRTELQNPTFARMTSPSGGVSVEDAYYAIHRKEIQAAAMQATAQETARKMSNAIQAGSRRPVESGTSAQAPSVTAFDYAKASKEQREALKAHIRAEAANGRKVYPGR